MAATSAKLDLPNQGVLTTDVTSAYAGFLLVGPRTEDFLRRLTHLDVRANGLPVNSCAETSLAGVEALLVRSPELAVAAMRIYVGWDMAEYVWERLADAGITPLGTEAVASLAKAD